MAERVKSNEVTCLKGHRVFVTWVPEKHCFAFECGICDQISPVAVSVLGYVICVLKDGGRQ